VFPNPNDGPARSSKLSVIPTIARDVAIELRGPVAGIRSWFGSVVWAPVPETAINEDDHAGGGEDDIAPAPDTRGSESLAEPQAATMQL
jgi:hypothetical protein